MTCSYVLTTLYINDPHLHPNRFIHTSLPSDAHIGRGRGRGLSNLPAWMTPVETVGNGSSSSGSTTVEMTTGQFEDNEGTTSYYSLSVHPLTYTLSLHPSHTCSPYILLITPSLYILRIHSLHTSFDL